MLLIKFIVIVYLILFTLLCSDLDRSTSTVHTTITTAAESYTPIQITAIRTDLETIMHAHLDVTDDKVAELLQYFNKSVNAILQGTTCDPRMIDQMLTLRFHQNVSVFLSFSFVILFYYLLHDTLYWIKLSFI